VHVSGPIPGSIHDMWLWKVTWNIIGHNFLPQERVLGDRGYVGDSGNILVPYKKAPHGALNQGEELYNIMQQFQRSSIEHAYSRLKDFAITSTPFRHHGEGNGASEQKHLKVFFAVANACNAWVAIEPVNKDARNVSLYLF